MKLISIFKTFGCMAAIALFAVSCTDDKSTDERAVKFYQSPMHPWITSPEPGNCTICGMALTPVYEGDAGASVDPNLLTLHETSTQVLDVTTAPVKRTELRRPLRFSGIFEDDDNLHRVVAAFYDGRIEKVYVDHVGEYVTKGTPLAAIYSPELLYVVRELQTAAQSGDKSILSSASRRLVQYGLTPAQVSELAARKEPGYTIDLLAPADGTILTRSAYEGQYIETGEALFETGNLDQLWFHAEVYERDLPAIQIGQQATLTTPVVPGREFPGVVAFVDPNFDPMTRSTKVRIDVDNPIDGSGAQGRRHLLPHRAYAEAYIESTLAESLVVPRSAILRDGRRTVAYVEKSPGAYEPRNVSVGASGPEGIQILDGLAEGERVVVQGNLMIDAEAQLRGNIAQADGDTSPATTDDAGHDAHAAHAPPPAITAFLTGLAEVSAALADDDAASATEAASTLPALATALDANAGGSLAAPIEVLQSLPIPPADADLPNLRAAVLPWNEAGADLVAALQTDGLHPDAAIFECPMTGEAFPGAPPTARWVQSAGPTRNPWFGAAMLECGAEVKP